MPNLNEVLSAVTVCRRYISAKGCSEKALYSLICLHNWVHVKKKEQNKPNYLIFLKQDQFQNIILFFYIFIVKDLWVQTQLKSMDFSGRKNPEHISSGRDFEPWFRV